MIREGWSEPGGSNDDYRSPFFHVARAGESRLVLLADVPVRYWGHWTRAGLQPCGERSCKLCDEGVGRQLRFVFDVYAWDQMRVAVWEVSSQIAARIRELVGEASSCRGEGVVVWKSTSSKQSRTEVRLWEGALPELATRFGMTPDRRVDLPLGLGAAAVLQRWWAAQGWRVDSD